jgi:hypothetical protein
MFDYILPQGHAQSYPPTWTQGPGLSLRDYFAAKAMQGFAATPHMAQWCSEDVATSAYRLADAMLAEREK